jgi:NAD(P)-dependent dehydrogenase (short-subunit alcohol dehydrogenase family)
MAMTRGEADNAGSSRGGVVVTGASSGIGRACALALDRAGFGVFATVRKAADGEALRRDASPHLVPVLLDVTKPESIAKAVSVVAARVGERGLHGLVNNAGVGYFGPLEVLPLDHLRAELAVNVTGVVAVSQGFMPLIRAGRGRIVNIGSAGGKVSLPFGGSLCASKFALEAVTDAFRMELAPWGIRVSLVRPGLIATPGQGKAHATMSAMIDELSPAAHALYGERLRRFANHSRAESERGSSPEHVARVVVRAMTVSRPKTHYNVGRGALTALLAALIPTRLLDPMLVRLSGATRLGQAPPKGA